LWLINKYFKNAFPNDPVPPVIKIVLFLNIKSYIKVKLVILII
jgi:hypothetical protein